MNEINDIDPRAIFFNVEPLARLLSHNNNNNNSTNTNNNNNNNNNNKFICRLYSAVNLDKIHSEAFAFGFLIAVIMTINESIVKSILTPMPWYLAR